MLTKFVYNIINQQSDEFKSILAGFFVLANRSNSAAASDLIVILSVVESGILDFGVVGPKGAPGDPDFFCNKELKKFAKTPSPPGVPTTFAPSN